MFKNKKNVRIRTLELNNLIDEFLRKNHKISTYRVAMNLPYDSVDYNQVMSDRYFQHAYEKGYTESRNIVLNELGYDVKKTYNIEKIEYFIEEVQYLLDKTNIEEKKVIEQLEKKNKQDIKTEQENNYFNRKLNQTVYETDEEIDAEFDEFLDGDDDDYTDTFILN